MITRIDWFARVGAVALALLIVLVVALMVSSPDEGADYRKQIEALRAEHVQYLNKHNELVSEKLAFEGSVKELKAQLKYREQQGDTLRSKLGAKTQAVILLKKQIRILGAGKVAPVPKDSLIYITNTVIDTPVVAVDTVDRWHSLRFAANGERYAYEVKVFDGTELVTEQTKKSTIVRVINRNPHVSFSEANSVVVERKKMKRGLWMVAGAVGALVVRKLVR